MCEQETLSSYMTVNDDSADEILDYNEISSHEELIKWSRAYAREICEETDLEIDFDRIIGWEVTTRAKRRAAAVESVSHQQFSVGYPVTDESFEDLRDDLVSSDHDYSDYREAKLILSWDAYEAFTEAECQRTLRHELIHIEQHQKYGTSNHRREFKRRAKELDTEVECPKFVEGRYLLICSECGAVVGERYRKSKTVKQPENYQSDCCHAELESKENPAFSQ